MFKYHRGECHPLVVDGPARLTDSSEKLRARIDQETVREKLKRESLDFPLTQRDLPSEVLLL